MTSLPARSLTTKALQFLAAATVAALVLAGCGPSLTPLEQAQQDVTDAEAAVTAAQSAFDTASDTFCSASEDYVAAIDVYGNIIADSAPTVGDVRNAGADLVAPRDEAFAGAEAAVAAQRELVVAQLDLIDAQAALAAAVAGPSGAPVTASPSPAPSVVPLAPAAVVDRVKLAEAEFTDAAADIDDDTLLTEAGEPFHSSAVALELSWIKLFVDAGCASEEQALRISEEGLAYTFALQQALFDLEFYKGAVDGIYGPQTTQAVADFQTSVGLEPTGTLNMATAQALEDAMIANGLITAQETVATTAAIQTSLKILGFWEGPIDGVASEELTQAIMDLQSALGLPPTGEVDAATVAAVQAAIAAVKAGLAPPEPSPEPSPSPSVPPAT